MKSEHEQLASGKTIMRSFDDAGVQTKETHTYGALDVACIMDFVAGTKVSETYCVNKRVVGPARYEKARLEYPDMPPPDPALAKKASGMIRLVGKEKRQRAAANKRRRENPLTEEQQREAKRQIPFFQAVSGEDFVALRQFLEAGEDPNSVAIVGGFTPLYSACFGSSFAPEKSLQAVRLLLEYGADPNKKFDYDSMIDGRLERDLRVLMMAGTAEIAEALLAAGAQVNVASATGVTPLMRAAGSGRADVVRVLMNAGADASARRDDGRMAADLARDKLEFFEQNREGCKPGAAEERIEAYRAVLRLLGS